MDIFARLRGSTGVKIIVGSALFWSWFDALFMGMFFMRPSSLSLMPELGAIAAFGFSVPFLVLAFFRRSLAERMLDHRRALILIAACGSLGSLLYVAAGLSGNILLLVLGGVFCGLFMAAFGLGWGAAYCHDGARSATPYVAGGFACAILIDTPLLFMIPQASAIFFSLLPLSSGMLFITVEKTQRIYHYRQNPVGHSMGKARSRFKNYLGLSFMLVGGMMLVMIGFGYVQHLVSFLLVAGADQPNGILIQIFRGITALLVFGIVVLASFKASAVYRIGLLAMIAGFMMMPFLFETDLFWVTGAVIIGGYTIFDFLVWVAFSQIAHTQSRDPLKTIAVMRIIVGLCYVTGAVAGMVLVGNGGQLNEFASAETTVVGYLVVIATVLLLSSEDIWMLSQGAQSLDPALSSGTPDFGVRLEAWFDVLDFTAREREVARLLVYGRTQPWIAESLGISDNTVGTHVRHIYQKAEVHNRQQFIDVVSCSPSRE